MAGKGKEKQDIKGGICDKKVFFRGRFFWKISRRRCEFSFRESLGQVQVLENILIFILTKECRGSTWKISAQAHTLSIENIIEDVITFSLFSPTEPAILTRCARITFMIITPNLKELPTEMKIVPSKCMDRQKPTCMANRCEVALHVCMGKQLRCMHARKFTQRPVVEPGFFEEYTSLHLAFMTLHTMALIDHYSITLAWHYESIYAESRDASSAHGGYSRLPSKELQ
ncbi:hypothetical protein VNO77_33886 [Canavalia gladiata]|uniref:Uncharacterized protein n=1 Tax=Canavalia gladiata TaxID=3824 RepID=A0AAN9KD93_CANGL